MSITYLIAVTKFLTEELKGGAVCFDSWFGGAMFAGVALFVAQLIHTLPDQEGGSLIWNQK